MHNKEVHAVIQDLNKFDLQVEIHGFSVSILVDRNLHKWLEPQSGLF
jgi:hypothetical protein